MHSGNFLRLRRLHGRQQSGPGQAHLDERRVGQHELDLRRRPRAADAREQDHQRRGDLPHPVILLVIDFTSWLAQIIANQVLKGELSGQTSQRGEASGRRFVAAQEISQTL
jgi:hypothetical protein